MVDRISTDFQLEEFEELHLAENKPCIFSERFTSEWRSRKFWVINGKPNLPYMKDNFVNRAVPIADCSQKCFNAHQKKDMLFHEFLNYWQCRQNSKIHDDDASATKLLYLKDWHFQREYPEYRAYEVLEYFKSDWLNECFDGNKDVADDYRFVYMGPQGTWTSFHADVFRSYSWSANICGRKKWILYRPGEEEHLKDRLGNLPFDVSSDQLKDGNLFPNAQKASEPIELIQEEGEVVFIPSGWHHQVYNLEDTISINHNWTNAYGINYMFQHLKSELKLVEKEIWEYRETDGWNQQCQLILKCSAGMDYEEFLKMLVALIKPRVDLLKKAIDSKKKDFRTQEDRLSDSLIRQLQSFRQFDIMCVAGEHLRFAEDDSIISGNNMDVGNSELLMKQLEKREKRIIFDLKRLCEAFRNLCMEAKFERDLEQESCLVSQVEKILQNL